MVVVSVISTRFRDVPQIVAALLQVLIFMTPVFWRPEALTGKRFVLTANPLYHMLEITGQQLDRLRRARGRGLGPRPGAVRRDAPQSGALPVSAPR